MNQSSNWKAKPYSSEYDEMRISIVDAAWDLIGQHGASSLRLDEVAKTAGCARSSIYRYFDSKKELIIAVLLKWLFTAREELEPILQQIEDPADRLIEGIYIPMQAIRSTPYFHDPKHNNNFLMASLALEAMPEIMSTLFDPFFAAAKEENLLRENVSSEEAARWVLTILIALGSFGSAGMDPDKEKAYLKKMIVPSLLKI